MTLLTMTIPDDPAELPRWLERRLMAPDFGRFVAELSAHFPAAPRAPSSPATCSTGGCRWRLTTASARSPPDVLTQLLRHPAVLAAFQERIVTDGGAYWDDVPDDLGRPVRGDSSAANGRSNGCSRRTPRRVRRGDPKAGPKAVAVRGGETDRRAGVQALGDRQHRRRRVPGRGGRSPGGQPAGRAAVPKAQIAWGWAKPGGLAADQSNPKDYLNKLAANAEEWSLHRPSDPSGVGTRIAEFRLGCTRLMHSPLRPAHPGRQGVAVGTLPGVGEGTGRAPAGPRRRGRPAGGAGRRGRDGAGDRGDPPCEKAKLVG